MTPSDHPKFISVAEPDIGPAEEAAVMDAVRSSWISSLGPYITEFERSFAHFCNVAHAACVSNGTVAIHLLLVAAGIKSGDEVIVPSLTFVATAAAVLHAGATPVFVDCDPLIGTMDPAAVAAAVSSRTKAIIAVHLYGHPADMAPLREIAESNSIYLFEDAAEAHGAGYRGCVVGSLGHAATFSFYGNKVITTGEGGMIVTDDTALDKRIRILRDHGMDPERRYWHPEVGYNYRLTNLQAAIGTVQIKRYAEITAKRQTILDFFRGAGFERYGIEFNPKAAWATPVPWLVCAVFPEEMIAKVQGIRDHLKQNRVDSRPYFLPIHSMPPYQTFRRVSASGDSALIATDGLSARGINLPSSGCLSPDSLEYISDIFTNAIENQS